MADIDFSQFDDDLSALLRELDQDLDGAHLQIKDDIPLDPQTQALLMRRPERKDSCQSSSSSSSNPFHDDKGKDEDRPSFQREDGPMTREEKNKRCINYRNPNEKWTLEYLIWMYMCEFYKTSRRSTVPIWDIFVRVFDSAIRFGVIKNKNRDWFQPINIHDPDTQVCLMNWLDDLKLGLNIRCGEGDSAYSLCYFPRTCDQVGLATVYLPENDGFFFGPKDFRIVPQNSQDICDLINHFIFYFLETCEGTEILSNSRDVMKILFDAMDDLGKFIDPDQMENVRRMIEEAFGDSLYVHELKRQACASMSKHK